MYQWITRLGEFPTSLPLRNAELIDAGNSILDQAQGACAQLWFFDQPMWISCEYPGIEWDLAWIFNYQDQFEWDLHQLSWEYHANMGMSLILRWNLTGWIRMTWWHHVVTLLEWWALDSGNHLQMVWNSVVFQVDSARFYGKMEIFHGDIAEFYLRDPPPPVGTWGSTSGWNGFPWWFLERSTWTPAVFGSKSNYKWNWPHSQWW